MKKIPSHVQSLLNASNQINNHSKAVEELVYNALDAGATSIAIRINIQENTIQVIDNGSGVYSKDFNSIGKKYMTSKFFDLSNLQITALCKYGFRGQFLANLINVSKNVKVVSRHEKSEETWMKLFEYGKEKEIKIYTARPSKGTTVEVRGFLYNLNIQKKTHSILGELQNIKTFLEHLSIVHNNISLSLRDDSKNEIVFKMHKNRDMYQTLSTLYNIEKKDFQELQVEKHEYKVTGILRKSKNGTGKHFIFLNRKFVTSGSKLHKLINNNLKKEITLKGTKKSIPNDTNKTEGNHLFIKNVPDYFIFIKCPYLDYNLNTLANELVLEFKDWNQINKILEKLTKFFRDDLNLNEITEVEKAKTMSKSESNETREQVKKIIERILGNQTKKSGIYHMQNGIKGKQIKRKVKKSTQATKLINLIKHNDNIDKAIKNKDVANEINKIDENQNIEDFHLEKKNITNQESNIKIYSKPCSSIIHNSKIKKIIDNNKLKSYNTHQQKKLKTKVNKTKKPRKYKDEILSKEMNADSLNRRCNELEQKTRNLLDQKHDSYKLLVSKNVPNHIISKNKKNMVIHKQKEEINDYKPKIPKYNLSMNNHHEIMKEKPLPSNYDLLQTMLKSQGKIYLHEQISNETSNFAPVMKQQPKTTNNEAHKPININSEKNMSETMVTFESHNYYTHHNMNLKKNATIYSISSTSLQTPDNENHNCLKLKKNFITKESRENFAIPKKSYKNHIFKGKRMKTVLSKQLKSNIKRLFYQTSQLFDLKKQILGNSEESTQYTIEFTKSDKIKYKMPSDKKVTINSRNMSIYPTMNIEEIRSESVNYNHISVNTNTYTVSNVNHKGYTIDDYNWNLYSTFTVEHSNEVLRFHRSHDTDIAIKDNCLSNRNIYISESQEHSPNQLKTDPLNVCETVLKNQETQEQIDDPINICDTILNSQEVIEKEFEFSFNNTANRKANLFNKINDNNDPQRRSENENDQNHQIVQDPLCVEKLYPEDIFQEVSYHFSLPNGDIGEDVSKKVNQSPLLNKPNKIKQDISENKQRTAENCDNPIPLKDLDPGDFNLKNRLGFVPKGMSQIFENCQTKNVLEYIDEDYYENEMYDNFVNNVCNNAEIFEPKIQEPKEITTKAIEKVNAKLNKDSSSLKFDAKCLKNAKVLGQIDGKFIATIMNGRCDKEEFTDFLVLFDQHAVHERIRLENNLLDYYNDNQWKPIDVDGINLKMSKDDILYLHNYKDKFEQLGLRWSVLDANEVSFGYITEAILGKNPRPVELVLKAVKNLIAEEISIIKTQGGCISLYPKSIMDLVFSEACRYAIKFGDKLSKNECVDLLNMLCQCKTPFQCAHGRPVMAVIMDIKRTNEIEYEINRNKIVEWKKGL